VFFQYEAIVTDMETTREIMTPDQAADYLQVNRETVYRYIRSGKLVASKLGKVYRIPRRGVELLLWSTRTVPQVPMRDYTPGEVAGFLEADRLDEATRDIAGRFLERVAEGAPQNKCGPQRQTSSP